MCKVVQETGLFLRSFYQPVRAFNELPARSLKVATRYTDDLQSISEDDMLFPESCSQLAAMAVFTFLGNYGLLPVT